jgi:putative transposase
MCGDALAEEIVCEIREATNKAWVLGNDRLRARVEALVERRISPCARGGDQKSEKFRERCKINRV